METENGRKLEHFQFEIKQCCYRSVFSDQKPAQLEETAELGTDLHVPISY